MKVAVLFVVFTFVATSIDPVAFANTSAAGEVSPFSSKTLSIPVEFGQITDMITGESSTPTFIHIQSAHGNYQAEKNIEKLLGYIEKNSSVKLMLLEGAANKLHPELFRIFPNQPDFNSKVTDKLMQEGYLTGPESFLIESSKSKVEGWGIEDLDAYKKDRDAFISVIKQDKTAEKFIGELRASIDKKFSAKLNKDLLVLVRQEEAFGSGTVSFEAWLKLLGESSKKHLRIDLSDAFYQDQYPFLIRYYRLQTIGSQIDREKARQEATAFLKELETRKMPKDILSSFQTILSMPENSLFKTGNGYSPLRLSFDKAFTKLSHDFSMKPWPAWTLYAQYAILMQELESKGLQEEVAKLKDNIFQSLAKTAVEKEYLTEARSLYLTKKLFSLELTRNEYEELLQHTRNSMDFLNANRSTLNALFEKAMQFYAVAVDRENKMFQNALKKMGETKTERAVIVTGGFHADGLKKLAQEKHFSYLQITPRITEVSKKDRDVYLKSMLGNRDVETSQIAALLGVVDRAQRVAITGRDQTREWFAAVRQSVLAKISTEPVSNQSDLTAALGSSLGVPTPTLVPIRVRSEARTAQEEAIEAQNRRVAATKHLPDEKLQRLENEKATEQKEYPEFSRAVAALSTDVLEKLGTFPMGYSFESAKKKQDEVLSLLESSGVIIPVEIGAMGISTSNVDGFDFSTPFLNEMRNMSNSELADRLGKSDFVDIPKMLLVASAVLAGGNIIDLGKQGFGYFDLNQWGNPLGYKVVLLMSKALAQIDSDKSPASRKNRKQILRLLRSARSRVTSYQYLDGFYEGDADADLAHLVAYVYEPGWLGFNLWRASLYWKNWFLAAEMLQNGGLPARIQRNIEDVQARIERSTDAVVYILASVNSTKFQQVCSTLEAKGLVTDEVKRLLKAQIDDATYATVSRFFQSRSEMRVAQEEAIKAQNRRVATAKHLLDDELQRLEMEKATQEGEYPEFFKAVANLPKVFLADLRTIAVRYFRRQDLPGATKNLQKVLAILEANGVIMPMTVAARWPDSVYVVRHIVNPSYGTPLSNYNVIHAQNRRVASTKGLAIGELQRLENEKATEQGEYPEFFKAVKDLPAPALAELKKPIVPPSWSWLRFRWYLQAAIEKHEKVLALFERNGVIVPVSAVQWPWYASGDGEMSNSETYTPFLDVIQKIVSPTPKPLTFEQIETRIAQLEQNEKVTPHDIYPLVGVLYKEMLYPGDRGYGHLPNTSSYGIPLKFRLVNLMAKTLAQIDLAKNPELKKDRDWIVRVLRGVVSPVVAGFEMEPVHEGDFATQRAHFVAYLYEPGWFGINLWRASRIQNAWLHGEEMLLKGGLPEKIQENIKNVQARIIKTTEGVVDILASVAPEKRQQVRFALEAKRLVTPEVLWLLEIRSPETFLQERNRRAAQIKGLGEAEIQRLESETANQGTSYYQEFSKAINDLPLAILNELKGLVLWGKGGDSEKIYSASGKKLPESELKERHAKILEILGQHGVIVPLSAAEWPRYYSGDESYGGGVVMPLLNAISAIVSAKRSEVRTAEAMALPVTYELPLPTEVSIPSLAEAGVSVQGLARTALEVTQGLLAVALLQGAKAKTEFLKLVMPERTNAISENLAAETRGIARMVLGVNQKVFETTDALALGPKLSEQLMENNGAGVIAMREAFMGTNIATLTDTVTLEKVNQVLEKAGLEKFLTAQALKQRLPIMKQPVIRAVIFAGETLSADDLALLQIADKNITRMTQRMLDTFMRVMEGLVNQMFGKQAMSQSA